MKTIKEEELKSFLAMSKYAGMREDLVQAGGGNSSVKLADNRMLIKASGYSMSDVSREKGHAIVDYDKILDFFESSTEISEKVQRKFMEDIFLEGEKPSIEVFLHAVTDKYTLHTHPITVNCMASGSNWETLKTIFPDALFIPYATPGIQLAKEYFKVMNRVEKENKCNLIFLRNHGLVVSAPTGLEVIRETEDVLSRLEKLLGIDMKRYHNTDILYQNLSGQDRGFSGVICLSQDRRLQAALDCKIGKMWNHTFCPDCVVYCGAKVLELVEGKESEEIKSFYAEYGRPSVILYKGSIYIVADNRRKAAEIESVLAFSAMVTMGVGENELEYLNHEEQSFLLSWEDEKYRKNLNN